MFVTPDITLGMRDTSTPPQVFRAWWLVKDKDNFILYHTIFPAVKPDKSKRTVFTDPQHVDQDFLKKMKCLQENVAYKEIPSIITMRLIQMKPFWGLKKEGS
jgi:hypothetical protein